MKFCSMSDGSIVEEDVFGVAREIYRRYGDRVRIQYMEPGQLILVTQYPYRILQWVQSETHPAGGYYEPLFGVTTLDDRVLFQLDQFDSYKNWSALAQLDKWEEEEEKRQELAELAFQEEARALMASAFRNDKTFRFKGADGQMVKLSG